MDGFTWVHNSQTDGTWQCPDGLLDELLAGGEWERCDAPVEVDPATAEHAAWREARAAESAAAEAEVTKPTRTPRSGESKE